ncbi:MAG TPA: DoxX family protein [Nitrosopumilaceae archaeon]|jgi:uncharacterized membrane protein YphA (DoxX/SURF4 family)|nr:DoxX family protein [Nitrosopumilaceae archaeon]
MSLIFKTPKSENLTSIGILILRIGIAFGFFWASSGKISDPAGFGGMLTMMVGIDPMIATNMALMIGIFELLSGIFVLIGLITRPAAIFQLAILIGALGMFGLDFSQGPGIWKDPALIGITIMLVLSGSGKFGIDHLISKKFIKSN